MPVKSVIDKEKRLVITTAWDRVTFAEVIDQQDQLRADAAFDPDFDQLVDASAVTGIDASLEEVKKAASHRTFSSASRRAFVATSPDVFAMGRLMGAHLGMGRIPQQVQVFYDIPSALKWLGLDQDPRPGR